MAFIPQLQKDFQSLVERDRLSHGYIFFGSDLDAQYDFAKSLAGYLEKKEWSDTHTLIDAGFFDSRNESGIDMSRKLKSFLWQMPIASKHRLAAVYGADELTLHAQNAILKIAEEPPEHAFLILIVRDPANLIAPLASRLVKFYFSETAAEESKRIKNTASKEMMVKVMQFITANSAKEKSEILKEIIEKEETKEFVSLLLAEFKSDIIPNWRVIKELLRRFQIINQFNVNKKLQLEAALI